MFNAKKRNKTATNDQITEQDEQINGVAYIARWVLGVLIKALVENIKIERMM